MWWIHGCGGVGGIIHSCALANEVETVVVDMDCCDRVSFVRRKGWEEMDSDER